MIDPPISQVRDWLADDASGVNAQIPQLPDPSVRPPLISAIHTETDHAWVARVFQGQPIGEAMAESGPLLLLGASDEVRGELRVDRLGGRVTVDLALVYIARLDRSQQLVSDARQTFRACLRAISAQFLESQDLVVWRDGVGIEQPSSWRVISLAGLETDDTLYGGLVLSIPVSDPWSLAIDHD